MKSILRSGAKSLYNFVTEIPNRLTIAAGRMGMIELYQPIYGEKESSGQRMCADRWAVMKKYLPKGQFSFMDIGSQIGYFTFNAAQEGGVSFGVERNKRYCEVAQAIKSIRNMDHVAFLNIGIDSFTVQGLPNVDVLCCMSIYHHWVRESGFEEADKIFTHLVDRTNSMFFDTGQSNELNTDWADSLHFMKPDPVAWIEDYLKMKGFTTVTKLGEFPTHLSQIPRMLYFASKVK